VKDSEVFFAFSPEIIHRLCGIYGEYVLFLEGRLIANPRLLAIKKT
jgi:hypothetical protein